MRKPHIRDLQDAQNVIDWMIEDGSITASTPVWEAALAMGRIMSHWRDDSEDPGGMVSVDKYAGSGAAR